MKNTIVVSLLFFITLACKSQIIPLEGIQEYLSANNISSVPDGAYLKDVNGLFDVYTGEWRATYNGRIYTFYITEEITTRSFDNIQVDQLFIKYLITEFDGTIVADTREEDNNSGFGTKFTSDLRDHIFMFGADRYECGNSGRMYVREVASPPLNTEQIEIFISYGTGAIAFREGVCDDFVKENEPLYPLSVTPVVLTRQ